MNNKILLITVFIFVINFILSIMKMDIDEMNLISETEVCKTFRLLKLLSFTNFDTK